MKIILLFITIKKISSTVVNYQMLLKTQIVSWKKMFFRMKKMRIGTLVWILTNQIYKCRATRVFKRKKTSSLKGSRN
jgi:hypothetical protein